MDVSRQSGPSSYDRRTVLAATGTAALATGIAGAVAAPTPATAETAAAGGTHDVTVKQGTGMALTVSPDGKLFALDLLATIWTLGADGGKAKRILPEDADATWPAFAPDGKRLAYQSYADGGFQIYVSDINGGGRKQLTRGRYDHREPVFSPDGRTIAVSSDRDGSSYGIYLLDPANASLKVLVNSAAEDYHPAFSPTGTEIAYVSGKGVTGGATISAIGRDGKGGRTVVTAAEGELLFAPAYAPDGKTIVYVSATPGATALKAVATTGGASRTLSEPNEDVFPLRPGFRGAAVVYTADGLIKTRPVTGGAAKPIPFTANVRVTQPTYRPKRPLRDDGKPRQVKGIVGPALAPDGKRVAFRALNDLWITPLGGQPKKITSGQTFESDPAWSPDGKQLAYLSDRDGKPDLWLCAVAGTSATHHRRLTDAPDGAALPAWSPDASKLAFIDSKGVIQLADAKTGKVTKVFGPLFAPGRPTFSPDGQILAVAALRPASKRFREGSSQILTINLKTGETLYRETMADRSLSTRGLDGPVWSPDGKSLAFIVDGVLWTQPVDKTGKATGAARQITTEPTDAPTWSGDSKTLLYLVSGQLRTKGASGGVERTHQVPLRWRYSPAAGRTIIHAGKMWDGVSDQLKSNVDIVIDGGRISAILPHQANRPAQHRIDASKQTVMPGLIDMHNHRHLDGRFLSSRQGRLWLSLGITTTRSPGDPSYEMVEERESTGSGARLAPRYIGTGEAIDGRRIYYNFMRPTRDATSLARELDRARRLEYDMLKNYVRLPVASQRVVIEWGHRNGIRTSSHYLHPATTLGVDGMEHVGATNRLGYSHTVSRNGVSYQDMIELFVQSKMALTPTLFSSQALYATDKSLFTDPRVKKLFPVWEYEKLRAAVERAKDAEKDGTMRGLRGWTATVTKILRGGGRIVAGTDAPIDNLGVSLHMNLRAMVRVGGLRPAEALRTATSAAADYLGVRDLGRISKGAIADLSIVDGDPLARIEDAAAVKTVLLGGAVHTVDSLVTLPAPTKPATTTPASFEEAGFEESSTRTTEAASAGLPAHPSQDAWWHTEHFVHEARTACCSH